MFVLNKVDFINVYMVYYEGIYYKIGWKRV